MAKHVNEFLLFIFFSKITTSMQKCIVNLFVCYELGIFADYLLYQYYWSLLWLHTYLARECKQYNYGLISAVKVPLKLCYVYF